LDFGHWSAHKLESLSHHELRHGEAVAIGLALDTRYSVEAGFLDAALGDRIVSLLAGLGLPTFHPLLEAVGGDGALQVLAGLREFQEHLGGELTVTLLTGAGRPFDCHAMEPRLIKAALGWLKQAHSGRTSPSQQPEAVP
jgi:3-dehydroquinate synthase